MSKILPGLFLLVAGLQACSNNREVSQSEFSMLSADLENAVTELVELNYLSTEKISRDQQISKAFLLMEKIKMTASEEELLLLINHPEGEIAALAFEGLITLKSDSTTAALMQLSEGDRYLNYIQGDMMITLSALEYAYSYVLGLNLGEQTVYNAPEINLSSDQILFLENRIMALNQALE